MVDRLQIPTAGFFIHIGQLAAKSDVRFPQQHVILGDTRAYCLVTYKFPRRCVVLLLQLGNALMYFREGEGVHMAHIVLLQTRNQADPFSCSLDAISGDACRPKGIAFIAKDLIRNSVQFYVSRKGKR